MANSRPVAIDLFAGAGGLSLGFEQAGFDVATAVEIDPIHCAAHEFNFPECATICGDVRDLTAIDIRKRAGLHERPVDVVCGGAPCQGFSMIGKRALEDPRNQLVSHFVRLVTELGARYFVFENVKGLTVGQHRKFLHELISEFEARGYKVQQPFRVLNAFNYGVPQSRERLFLFGAKEGLPLPFYPLPTSKLADKERDFELPPTPTVWDALSDLPEPEDFDELLESDSVKARFGRPSDYAASLRGRADDAEDFSHPRQFDQSLLTSSLRAIHTALSRQRFAATLAGTTEQISRFYRLPPNGVSNTLRAGTASDRGAFTSPRPIHPFKPRCVTVREAARLHSYPDWFRFHVTKWHGFRQIGNSVPPLLGRAAAAQVIIALGVLPTKPANVIELGDSRLLRFSMSEAAKYYGVPHDTIAKRIRAIPMHLAA
jgi:DNA (cytosine-5)-methyltransferase 1